MTLWNAQQLLGPKQKTSGDQNGAASINSQVPMKLKVASLERMNPLKITKYAIIPSRIGCLAVKDAPSDCTLVYGVTIGSGRGFGVFRAIMALPPFNCDVLPMKGG